jgi:hypothetical protein
MKSPPPPSNSPSDDDSLERLLRETSFHAPPLDDNGFSARVLAALPPPKTRRAQSISRRTALCLAGAGIGLAASVPQLRTIDFPSWQEIPAAVGVQTAQALAWASEPSQLLTLCVLAATLGWFYWSERRPHGQL